jgi:hypothetical protein
MLQINAFVLILIALVGFGDGMDLESSTFNILPVS